MKNSSLRVLTLALITSVVFVGCSGLGKMVKNAGNVAYEVKPSPLEMHGDSISVTISGNYPAKFFLKKANLKVTPVLKYAGSEKELKAISLVGESSTEQGTKIKYVEGGKFSYTDKVAYQPDMNVAELTIKATAGMKKVTKDLPEVKVAQGTITTPTLVKNDEKPLLGKDKFQKVIPVSNTANIYYVVNQSVVRPSEMTSAEIKTMKEFVAEGVKKGYNFKNIEVSAYASPDGEQSLNANLAENRAKSASKALQGLFKDKKYKVEAATKEDFYKTVTTAEDWDGFKRLMSASNIADKDLILRVLTMYSDLDVREREIKNLSKTYLEIADKILPKLRRSVLTLNAELMSRSDETIMALANSTADSLSVEELLYAATLTNDLNAQLAIYKSAEKIYPQDWRGINNAGYIYLRQNKLSDAQAQFEKAKKIDASNSIVANNLGIVARWKGDRKAASELYQSALSAGPEVNYNLGVVNILDGNYEDALSNMSGMNTFNSALAKLLSGDSNGALSTLDASNDKDAAVAFYLKAIAGARTGNADLMINNLKAAINKDASFKSKAKSDAEFIKFRDNETFKAIVG